MLTWEDAQAILSADVRMRLPHWSAGEYVFRSTRSTASTTYWKRRADAIVPWEPRDFERQATNWEVADF